MIVAGGSAKAGAKTDFALDGRHAQTDCAGCHSPEVARKGARYRRLKAAAAANWLSHCP